MQMSLFEDFGIRQIKEDVKKLELQIRTVNMPDKLRFRKMNLLAELYENLGEFEKADNTALTVIKQGTVVARKDTEVLDIVRDAYCIRGKRHFDDYMIATEWNREKNARFWLPRRKILEGQLHLATKLDNFMNDPNMRLLSLSMPPGTGKSTLIKFLLAYIAGVYPMSANMYVSYSDGMIKMMYDSVVDMLTDDFEYQHTRIFGERATPTTSAQYGTISYRRRGDFPTIGMISLGGSVTGRTRANKFLITDDLVKNAEVARSPERLEKLWQDYTSTLTTRQIGDNVKQIMLGTIWSAYDPISRMMSEHENDPQYEFVCIPVWDENEHSNFLYDHPDRYTDEKIRERQESLDPVDFSCLYLQNPVEKEGMPLKANELMYYNGVLPDGEPDDIFFVTDVAWGGGDSLSMPVIYAYGDDWYLHDVVFDTSNKEVTRPRVVGKILQHACKSGRFEDRKSVV